MIGVEFGIQQQAGETDDAVEGGADLMAHVRQIFALGGASQSCLGGERFGVGNRLGQAVVGLCEAEVSSGELIFGAFVLGEDICQNDRASDGHPQIGMEQQLGFPIGSPDHGTGTHSSADGGDQDDCTGSTEDAAHAKAQGRP